MTFEATAAILTWHTGQLRPRGAPASAQAGMGSWVTLQCLVLGLPHPCSCRCGCLDHQPFAECFCRAFSFHSQTPGVDAAVEAGAGQHCLQPSAAQPVQGLQDPEAIPVLALVKAAAGRSGRGSPGGSLLSCHSFSSSELGSPHSICPLSTCYATAPSPCKAQGKYRGVHSLV